MNKKYSKYVGGFLFILGVAFLLNLDYNFTGAVVGVSIHPGFSSILGLVFILVGVMMFVGGKSLDEELEEYYPVIPDANYLIDSCKNHKDFQKIKEIIDSTYSVGNPLIVSKRIIGEINPSVEMPQGQKQRESLLKKELKEKTKSLEEIYSRYSGKRKKKYEEISKNILEQTPKYLTYAYLSRIHKGEKDLNINNFINENKRVLNNPFTREEITKALERGKREYDQESNKGKLLCKYGLGKGDIEVFTNALYLQNVPDRVKGLKLKRVNIITKDEHLIQGVKIFDYYFKSKRKTREGSIRVKNTL
jgi:hypothetical protein